MSGTENELTNLESRIANPESSTDKSIKWSDELEISEYLNYGDEIQVIIEESREAGELDAISHHFGTRVLIAPTNLDLSAGDRVNVKVTLVKGTSIETIAITRADR